MSDCPQCKTDPCVCKCRDCGCTNDTPYKHVRRIFKKCRAYSICTNCARCKCGTQFVAGPGKWIWPYGEEFMCEFCCYENVDANAAASVDGETASTKVSTNASTTAGAVSGVEASTVSSVEASAYGVSFMQFHLVIRLKK
jgi:hypothetical protein